VRAGTTTGASKLLNLSQPAISRLLSDFEKYLGFSLFNREKGRLVPTAAGLAFYEEVERTFAGLENLGQVARQMRSVGIGQVRTVVSSGLSRRFLPSVIAAFMREAPDVSVTVDIRTTEYALEMVLANQADLAVVLLPADHPGLEMIPLVDVQNVCVLPADHPLVAKPYIGPADLIDEPLILIDRKYPVRQHLDDMFRREGIEPIICMETTSTITACGCVANGIGIAIANHLMAIELNDPNFVLKPLRPALWQRFSIALVANSAQPHAVRLFIDCLKRAVAEFKPLAGNEAMIAELGAVDRPTVP
jgi:DNA-binding transcriptional LysR family regulator